MVWRKPRFTNDLARRSSYLITGVASDRCNPFESAGLANSPRNAPPKNDPLMTAGALRYAARNPIVPSRAREIERELDAPLISGGHMKNESLRVLMTLRGAGPAISWRGRVARAVTVT